MSRQSKLTILFREERKLMLLLLRNSQMIRKIIALCLVLMAVSFVFSGCKKDEEPTKPDVPDTKDVEEAPAE